MVATFQSLTIKNGKLQVQEAEIKNYTKIIYIINIYGTTSKPSLTKNRCLRDNFKIVCNYAFHLYGIYNWIYINIEAAQLQQQQKKKRELVEFVLKCFSLFG